MQLGLAAWHRYMQTGDPAILDAMTAQDAVFHSPVVHTPQAGHAKVMHYLGAARTVFADSEFTYVRELVDGTEACLEFTAVIDGVQINGIDLIRFDLEGRIADFKVMIRPLKAMQMLWQKMATALEST
jgi:SnoaL-like domain